jgi:hypothetical protein
MAEPAWQRFPFHAAPYLFAIFFVLYSHEINHFNLTIDDERHAFSSADFVALGRWLIPIVQSVWPQPVVPWAPYLIFGALISVSYCLVLGLLGVRRPAPFHYLCFAAFIAFPAFPAQLEYAAHVMPIGVAFLCAVLAVVLTLDADAREGPGRWLRLAAAVLLCTLAAAAYQTAILIYPVILLPLVAYRTFLGAGRPISEAMGSYLTALAVLAAATGLYAAIAVAVMAATGVPPATDYLSSAYMGSETSPLGIALARLYEFPRGMYRVIYGWWWNFGIARYVFVAALGFCGLVIMGKAAGSLPRLAATGLVLLAVTLAPGALILVSGREMPLRTFVAAPAVFLIVFLLANRIAASPLVRGAINAILVLFVVQCLYVNATQQARAWVTERHDEAIAGALNRDIMAMVDAPEEADITIDVFGIREARNTFPRAPTVLLGESFVEWTRDSPVRIVLFMNLMGFYQYRILGDAERARLKPQYADMAVWPHPGSIRVVDGVVLVKLGRCEPVRGGGEVCDSKPARRVSAMR